MQFLCVVFEIFEFEDSAISLYGHSTIIYGNIMKTLISNISKTEHGPSDFNYKIHILHIWELPDYVPLTLTYFSFLIINSG